MKFFRCLFALNMYLFLPILVFAQQEQGSFIGLNFGGNDFHMLDKHASPLIFRRLGLAPSLQFFHKSKSSRQYVEVSFSRNNLKTTQDNFNVKDYSARFRASYEYSVFEVPMFRHDLRMFMGGSIQSFFNKSDYYFKNMTSDQEWAITSWYWSHSLDLSIQLEYNINTKGTFLIRLNTPIVSNISRPEYSPGGDYNYTDNTWYINVFGKTVFFPENRSVDASFIYQKKIGSVWYVQLSYQFYYAHYPNPQSMTLYMNNLRIGILYRIRI